MLSSGICLWFVANQDIIFDVGYLCDKISASLLMIWTCPVGHSTYIHVLHYFSSHLWVLRQTFFFLANYLSLYILHLHSLKNPKLAYTYMIDNFHQSSNLYNCMCTLYKILGLLHKIRHSHKGCWYKDFVLKCKTIKNSLVRWNNINISLYFFHFPLYLQ